MTTKIVYGSIATLFSDDGPPLIPDEGLAPAIYNNFTAGNKVEWRHSPDQKLYWLYDVVNRQYNDEGALVGGEVVWSEYQTSFKR